MPPMVERVLELLHLDFAPTHRQPTYARVGTATIVAVLASLLVDAVLVAIGTAVFPSTRGYVHFGFADYAKLTVLGVVVACLAWPVVTRVSSAPRWLYLRLAVAVTLVLWIPDLWILAKGQPPEAVAVLMVMHLAIAVVTYNSVVRIAKVTRPEAAMALAFLPLADWCTAPEIGALSLTAVSDRPQRSDGVELGRGPRMRWWPRRCPISSWPA